MSKLKGQQLVQLVKLVTGFEEEDENFQLCMNFAESNFKYHRFLGPDSHKLERAVTGLCEKFKVHSQGEKAEAFQNLVDKFLQTTGLEGRDYGKTDTHYAMLSLLLELAESPTKVDFTPTPERKPDEMAGDDFDWKAYLLDPAELNFMSFASSDSESEEEDLTTTEEEDDHKRVDFVPDVDRLTPQDDDDTIEQQEGQGHISLDVLRSREPDEWAKLEQALVVQYWLGKGREVDEAGDHYNSNLIRDWNYYKQTENEFYTPTANILVTEQQIIREVLWMLSGVKDLFIFHHNGKEFHLNPDIYVMHLTSESLESSLQPLMKKADQTQSLLTFMSDVTSEVCEGQGSCDMPQTYQAFACCLSTFLADLGLYLTDLEKKIISQEHLMTLDKLHKELQPWLVKLQAVHGVYVAGIASYPYNNSNNSNLTINNSNNCMKSSLLLNVLYQAVMEVDLASLGDDLGHGCPLLLEMLIKCSEPMLRITSDWINFGQLQDPAGEFVLHRNEDIRSLDETFWEKAFISNLNTNTAQTENITQSQSDTTQSPGTTVTNQPSSSNPKLEITSRMNDSVASVLGSLEGGCSTGRLPRFLQPILGQAVLTGKSMEMLETLGKMEVAKDQPTGLYQYFLDEISKKLKGLTIERTFVESDNAGLQDKQVKPSSPVNQVLSMRGQQDTLLQINITNLFPKTKQLQQRTQQQKEQFRIKSSGKANLSQVLPVCEDCLLPYVQSRYRTVCSHLLKTLKTDYKLMDCMQAMQRYFLMSAGEVMYDFYTPIFLKLQHQDYWRDESLLNMFLHEALDARFPTDTTKLSIQLISAPTTPVSEQQAINSTDCINLRYDVPWPVDVVISSNSQQLYNTIFTFLLQIKRSKFSLVQLRFEDLSRHQQTRGASSLTCDPGDGETMAREERVHRFYLLRFRLLYFVDSLHNYIMTRILHSTGLEFGPQLDSATDLEQVISLHSQYIAALHDRCLLHPRLSVLRKAVLRVLNLCLSCSAQWKQGVDFINGKMIEEMEKELARCIHFLTSFLNNVIKRGSFPHLESLAFSLASSLQQIVDL